MKKKLSIGDLQVRDIIIDMAEALKVPVKEDTNEIFLEIPKKLGRGYIKAYSFSHGVGVLEMDVLLKDKMEFVYEHSVVQPLKILFNRNSTIKHRFHGVDEEHEIHHLQSAILSSNVNHWHKITIPAEAPVTTFSLEINRKLFEEKIEAFIKDMNEDLEGMFRDVNGVNLFYYKGFFSLEISQFIEQFINCDLEGFMRSVYLEGKAYEILTHQLKQYLDDLNEPDGRCILRKSTVNRIEEAAKIIREEIDAVENVPELAKRVGINQNTLQNGFQQLYKTSVNEFIGNTRIEKAKDLLENSDLNVTEITYKIGISSRSYFSKLFKQRYGLTPKKYLEKSRNGTKKPSSA